MPASPIRFARPLLLGAVPLAAVALAAMTAACSHGSPAAPAAQRDYATVRPSEQGAWRVSYRSEPAPVPINRMHAWTVHVERPDGSPVDHAAIAVGGDMPEHGHGLPTRPRMTRELGGGDYLVEGVKFQMGGWWVMDLTVSADGRTDVARFNLQLR